ncbi:hypothetical protein FDP41_008512 [Naegleria fowleri]|uniref:N-acetyl-D-glucosamine kinase n=1 Tax=Naegleria fowleri TaxID=5763 RepID=A0A6A5BH00_NAEFO|nr:uncharacterized protein FDP41_008512 [Naegleria fowleri]KAF0973305.1 hypothetical protein FDP41_008512 [Naegleria fowleri]
MSCSPSPLASLSRGSVTIGVDGGSTGTTVVVLCNETQKVLAMISCAPSNKNSVGAQKAQQVISDGIKQALKEASSESSVSKSLGLDDVSAVCLGMSGVDRPNDIEQVRSWMIELFTTHHDTSCNKSSESSTMETSSTPEIYIFNDAVAAICSGTLGALHDVICLIAGTGSICLGTNNDGESFTRTGGWGPLLGDRGSGFWLGSKVLLSAVDYTDEYNTEKTVLAQLVKEELGLNDMSELIPYVYQDKEWSRIARFAPLCFKAIREHDDPVAKQLVDEMISNLKRMVETNARKLKLGTEKKFTLVYCGSILTHDNSLVGEGLSRALKETFGDQIEIIERPKVDPAVGSALYYLNNKKQKKN